jgi:hypothetical protein
VNKVIGLQLELSVVGVMLNGKLKFGSCNAIMSVPCFIPVLCVCTLLQRTYNSFYHMEIRDLNPHIVGLPAEF